MEALLFAADRCTDDETGGRTTTVGSLPLLSPLKTFDEMLVLMIGTGSNSCELRFGVPSRLGRDGGILLVGDESVVVVGTG